MKPNFKEEFSYFYKSTYIVHSVILSTLLLITLFINTYHLISLFACFIFYRLMFNVFDALGWGEGPHRWHMDWTQIPKYVLTLYKREDPSIIVGTETFGETDCKHSQAAYRIMQFMFQIILTLFCMIYVDALLIIPILFTWLTGGDDFIYYWLRKEPLPKKGEYITWLNWTIHGLLWPNKVTRAKFIVVSIISLLGGLIITYYIPQI